nr:membrane protein [Beutenbergia cavernae]
MTTEARADPHPAPGSRAATLGPIDQLRAGRLGRRLTQLVAGLLLYGFSMAMLVESGLGLDPWDVLHEGIALRIPLTFGQVTIAVGVLVLLAWIPLRQKPGIGTVLNVILIGLAADAGIALLPRPDALGGQVALLVGGIVLNGLAGALYVGTHLGTGPRDGLWVGLARRTGRSQRLVRTVIEVSVLAVGFALGGTVGVGTVLYAVSIGPLVQLFMPWVAVRLRSDDGVHEH